jgi:hypothetical protein
VFEGLLAIDGLRVLGADLAVERLVGTVGTAVLVVLEVVLEGFIGSAFVSSESESSSLGSRNGSSVPLIVLKVVSAGTPLIAV